MLSRLQASRWCSSRLLLTNVSCLKVLRPSQVKHKSFSRYAIFVYQQLPSRLVVLPRGHVSRVIFLLSRLLRASRGYSPPFRLGPGSPPVGNLLTPLPPPPPSPAPPPPLLDDHTEPEAPSFSLVADQLIMRPIKRRKEITDILSWLQAFSKSLLSL